MPEFLKQNELLINAALFLGTIAIIWFFERANRILFRELRKRQPSLQLLFFEHVISVFIVITGIIVALSVFGGVDNVWKSLLGGTAIISAVVAFVAQDVIKDILAGMMITLYKPFEVGNRIQLEDGMTGIVRDITMRHVVLLGVDYQRIIIPNSKLNAMTVRNYSYHSEYRSAQFQFYVAYGTEIGEAMRVIREAVISSPYSIPTIETESGPDYGPVYFMAYEESSLRLVTTVFYNDTVRSEQLISDINVRVNRALADAGIEVPYQYVNVIQKQPATVD